MKFVPGEYEAARRDAPRTGRIRRSAFVGLPQSVHEQPGQDGDLADGRSGLHRLSNVRADVIDVLDAQ